VRRNSANYVANIGREADTGNGSPQKGGESCPVSPTANTPGLAISGGLTAVPTKKAAGDINQVRCMSSESPIAFYTLYSWTSRYLDSFAQCVKEGHSHDEARGFCVYLLNSGVIKLLEANSCPGAFKVDGPLVRWKAEELQRNVQDFYRTGRTEAKVDASTLDAINRKLDLIAGGIGKLFNPQGVESPTLRVIEGGQQ